MGVLGIMAAVGVLLAGVGVAVRLSGRRRVEELQVQARRLGWGFRPDVPFDSIPDLERFELFRTGRRKTLSNLLTSPVGDPRAVIFDYAYTTGGGNSQRRHHQTVFYATGDRLDVAAFSVRPENFFHRVAALLGHQDIDLDGHPDFSRMFVLRGANESAVRALFTRDVARFFERHAGMCAAGRRHELLFWRPGRRVDPTELEALIRDGFELAERLSTPAERA